MSGVAIVLPSLTMVHSSFTVSLARMVGYMKDTKLFLINTQSAYIFENRNKGVRKALPLSIDHVLLIDSDMSFPTDGLLRLLAADKDIIGANYVNRAPPFKSLAVAKDGNTKVSGIVEVSRLPTGFMLVKREVFEKMPEPWFWMPWLADQNEPLGEDYYFCDQARSHGFSVWMDVPLSLSIVHWGDAGFRWSTNSEGYETIY